MQKFANAFSWLLRGFLALGLLALVIAFRQWDRTHFANDILSICLFLFVVSQGKTVRRQHPSVLKPTLICIAFVSSAGILCAALGFFSPEGLMTILFGGITASICIGLGVWWRRFGISQSLILYVAAGLEVGLLVLVATGETTAPLFLILLAMIYIPVAATFLATNAWKDVVATDQKIS